MKTRFILQGALVADLCPVFHAPDGAPSGASAASEPKTLAEAIKALNQAKADFNAEKSRADTAEATRTAAEGKVSSLETQFTAATEAATQANKERDQAKADLTAAQTTIGALTTERDQARAEAAAGKSSIARLEALCGVKGIDPSAAVPTVGGPEASGDGAALAQQWSNLKRDGKFVEAAAFYKAHQAALAAYASSAK